MARSIADSAWALFATLLKYKASWRGATLTVAHRFFPSTRRCSACGLGGEKLELSERTFHCSGCGHETDRDTNAAANLANYASDRVVASGAWSHVDAKHVETLNVCGEEGLALGPWPSVKLASMKQTRLRPNAREGRCWQRKLSTRCSYHPG